MPQAPAGLRIEPPVSVPIAPKHKRAATAAPAPRDAPPRGRSSAPRIWTAPQAAGVIHTDFEKGYIRAEVIAYDDYIGNKGEQGAKEAGKLRLEGKEYVVREGDVMHFRFNV